MHGICGIYILKNIVNGKVYIGQSVDILSRNKRELSGKDINIYFRNDLEIYGKDSFSNDILEIIDYEDIEYMDEREAYWISRYKSTMEEFGYNILPDRILPWSFRHKNGMNKPDRKRKTNYKKIYLLEDSSMGKRITISISDEDYNRISNIVGDDRHIKYCINIAINKWVEYEERKVMLRERVHVTKQKYISPNRSRIKNPR